MNSPIQHKKSSYIWIIVIIVVIIIIFVIRYFVHSGSTKVAETNNTIVSMELDSTNINDDNVNEEVVNPEANDPTGTGINGEYAMRDYYVFSSYNSCNNNSTNTNNKVDTQSLKNVIAQGVRFLDFEIYSINNEPVVATSSIPNNYFIKESNGSVPFRNVFDSVINTAFNISTAPNPSDPLFVHLRIQSTNQKMFSNMAVIFKNYENSGYILGPKYSFEYQDCKDSNNDLKCSVRNITSLPLKNFKSKIIIMIDKQNVSVVDNKDLMEFCNLMTSSINCRLLTNYEMKNAPDQNELIEFNKRSMCIVTPDVSANPDNPNISTANLLGIQFTAINFSKEDEAYKKAYNFFSDHGTAFILKPEELRYRPLYIPVPKDPPPGYSFAPRELKSRYVNFQI